ncbi:MAG: hypothetical protein CVV64_07490 [Candidatus Wallbacteria bacterium HGW-Wallbacteria-1]|jgi:HEAT repeat protein|uniref:Uncharacterized protein n=1 Tax=Candidatus Wallbacteria bacterium HGW-Wallbacteria-1 TaxID=2013854 RepID=A0A2N1PQV5_9BACT|nr:MAG: hypothetical protein CVV64_07490 [Candidatus Wallbacteria bacterium HGW-Wallbacteria-1]
MKISNSVFFGETLEKRKREILDLAALGNAEVLPGLMQLCIRDPESEIRRIARQCIQSIRRSGQIQLTGFSDLDSSARLTLVNCLASKPRGSHADFMKEVLLSDPDPIIRRKAIIGLGLQGDRTSVPFLSSLSCDEDPVLIPAIVRALRFLDDPLSLLALPGICLDNNFALHEALKLINGFPPGRIYGFFVALMNQPGTSGKLSLIRFAEKFPRRDLIPLLKEIASTGSEELSRRARVILESETENSSPDFRGVSEEFNFKPERIGILAELRRAIAEDDSGMILEGLKKVGDGGFHSEAESEIFTVMARAGEPTVKAAAIRMAGILGTSRALAKILRHLSGNIDLIRAAAAESLSWFVADPAVPEILNDLISDSSPLVVASACKALASITGMVDGNAIDRLLTEMGEEGKLLAIDVISSFGDSDMAETLVDLTCDSAQAVSAAAVESLESLALLGSVRALKFLADNSKNIEVSDCAETGAIIAFSTIEIDSASVCSDQELRILDQLLFNLESGDERMRLNALREIRDYDDPVTLEAVRIATRDQSRNVRKLASATFRFMKTRKGMLPKSELFHVENAIGGSTVSDPAELNEILVNGDRTAKIQALKSIPFNAGSMILEVLTKSLAIEKDSHVKPILATVTGMVGDSEVVPLLSSLLRDEDSRVRANAVEALCYTGDKTILSIVAPMINDSERRPRQCAVNLFKSYEKPGELVFFLESWAFDGDRERRLVCARLLGYLAQSAREPFLGLLLKMIREEKSGRVLEMLVKALTAVCIHLEQDKGDDIFRIAIESRPGASRQRVLKKGFSACRKSRMKIMHRSDVPVTEVFASNDFLGSGDGEFNFQDIDAIRREISNSDNDIRRIAIDAMMHVSNLSAADLDQLVQIMLNDDDGTVRYAAARVLKRVDSGRYDLARRGSEVQQSQRIIEECSVAEEIKSESEFESVETHTDSGKYSNLNETDSSFTSELACKSLTDDEVKKLVLSLLDNLGSEIPRLRGAARAQLVSMRDTRVDKVILYASPTISIGLEKEIRAILRKRSTFDSADLSSIKKEKSNSRADSGSLNSETIYPVIGKSSVKMTSLILIRMIILESLTLIIRLCSMMGKSLADWSAFNRVVFSCKTWIAITLIFVILLFFNGWLHQFHSVPYSENLSDNVNNKLSHEQRQKDELASHFQRAGKYRDGGDYSGAIEVLKKIVSRDMENTNARLEMASLHGLLGNREDELREYHLIMQINRRHAFIYYNMAIINMKMGNSAEALKLFLKAFEDEPGMVESCYQAGLIHAADNRLEEASKCFLKVLELKPDHSEAFRALDNL